jgi:hypothetical protein
MTDVNTISAVNMMGHNNPPVELTAFDAVKINIDDLYDEAVLWLDGEPITTQDQADALNTLMSKIKEAANAAEDQRTAEKKPLDDAINEIQGRYNPLISGFFSKNKTVGKATMAMDAAKKALKPYLDELDRRQQEAARIAREEADRKQREAMEAMRARDSENLAQREEAERLAQEAKFAEAAATRAENAKAHAKGDGRATGLRTVHRAVMADRKQAAAWVWVDHNDALMAFIQDLADKAVRSGSRKIPGFDVIEEKVL